MCETVTCRGNPGEMVSCRNPGKLVYSVNPGMLVYWENLGKLVDERIIATNREQMTVCMSACLGNPRRTGKLGEKLETQENRLYEGNCNVCGTATCRGNQEALVSWGCQGEPVSLGNPGKLINWENPGKLVRRRKHCYKTRTDDGMHVIGMCV